jgi:hypothetical protein
MAIHAHGVEEPFLAAMVVEMGGGQHRKKHRDSEEALRKFPREKMGAYVEQRVRS